MRDGHSPEQDYTAPLAGAELRRRATGGAALLAARAGLILVLGVAANIVLARLLVPRDFGLVALGTAFILLGTHLAAGGLGAALIRRQEEPTPRELAAISGVQLAATAVLALLVAGVAVLVGPDALVVATMVATLPIIVVRTPAVILLERRLHYRAIATVDVLEAVAFYAFAITAVALGAGVWGVAAAAVFRAVVGTGAMIRLGPLGLIRPRWSWDQVRPLVGFGAKMQAVGVAGVAREQALNTAVAAVAGIATLGVWNLAWRVLQVAYTLFATVSRVLYPTMARVLGAGEDVRPLVERALATVAVANGAIIVAIAGFAPALPVLVGPEWGDVPATILWAAVALIVGAPHWVVVSSYLYAADEPGIVLRGVLLHALVWFVVALPLVEEVGAPIIGVGWIAAAIAGNMLLARRTVTRSNIRIASSLAAPTLTALTALAVSWAVASPGSPSILRGLGGAICGELVLLLGLGLVRRSVLRETFALLAESVRGSVGVRPIPPVRGA